MHIILALAGLAVTAFFWLNRAKRSADVAGELIDVAQALKNAPRRFGFRRRANQHPVEGIDDPSLAIGGLAVAFLELDDLPTAETRARTDHALRKHLNLDGETAQEITVLGRWFVEECKGAQPAFTRLAKRLKTIDGGASFQPLMAVLKDIVEATNGTPSGRQSDALSELARIFRLQ
jgi:uncharacterized tellurite resistance protein B-like protein